MGRSALHTVRSAPYGASGRRVRVRCATCLAVVVALTCVSTAAAGRLVSVGYAAPSALRGLDVVARVPALRVAEVSTRNAATLRTRPGIRFVDRTVARSRDSGPTPTAGTAAPAEWQWAAAHGDQVPPWVLEAAS